MGLPRHGGGEFEMSRVLVYDLETGGFPKKWSARYTQTEMWPSVLQLSYEIVVDGETTESVNVFFESLDPVHPDAEKTHGLTEQFLRENADPHPEVQIQLFVKEVDRADRVIGHNVKRFDWPFFMSWAHRWGVLVTPLIRSMDKLYDTMTLPTKLLQLPFRPPSKRKGKFASLKECAEHWDLRVDGPLHDARTDVAITRELYNLLRKEYAVDRTGANFLAAG